MLITTFAGRIVVEAQPGDECVEQLLIGVRRSKTGNKFSAENILVNRIALGLEKNIPEPIGAVLEDSIPQAPPGQELRDYQITDLQKLTKLRYALNANRPGYGKTVEGLMYARLLGAERVLILCPKISKEQWAAMAAIWGPVGSPVQISPRDSVGGDSRRLVIDNYEQLFNPKVYQQYKSTPWDVLIVDEVHRIRTGKKTKAQKNNKSGTTLVELVKGLPGHNRLGMTGSPIYNRPEDLWGVCDFLYPGYFGSSYHRFTNHFCEIIADFWGRKPGGLVRDADRIRLLTDTLDCFMVRNPDNLVGKGVQENDVILEMEPAQKKLYKSIKDLVESELDEAGISIPNALSQTIKLQQVTSNPEKFGLTSNIKFAWIEAWLEDTDRKLVVFSRFRETILALQALLGELCVSIHGGLTGDERLFSKKQFMCKSHVRVMAGTIGAMGESIDGLQHVCHNVVFLDKCWSPEENDQAMRRVYRFGQETFVDAYTLVCKGTIDAHVGRVNFEKAEDIRKVIG